MVEFNPAKLVVTYKGVTASGPICPRRYTLTSSDHDGKLLLTVESTAQDVNLIMDQVSAQWNYSNSTYSLLVKAEVDNIPGPCSKEQSQYRYTVLSRQLPFMLKAIRYGDSNFFNCHAELDYAPIYVHFNSVYPEFGAVKYFGQPLDYLFIS